MYKRCIAILLALIMLMSLALAEVPTNTPLIEESNDVENYATPEPEGSTVAESSPEPEFLTIDAETFPDPIFYKYISDFDRNKDGKLSQDENMAVTRILLSNSQVQDITGVKHFKNLKMLSLDGNKIVNLDVSGMDKLTELWCKNNLLETLNVSGCTNLNKLICYNNQLSALDLSSNINLSELSCINNNLQSLDLNNNIKLEYLYCYGNKLESLNISKCTELNKLSCYSNMLKDLELPQSPYLVAIWCNNNLLESLDLSPCPNLLLLSCHTNLLKSLNLSVCQYLDRVNCSNNSLLYLDISNNIFTLDACNFSPQFRDIKLLGNKAGDFSFNLKELEPELDFSKIINLQKGSINGDSWEGILEGDTLSYDYELSDLDGIKYSMNVNIVPEYEPYKAPTTSFMGRIFSLRNITVLLSVFGLSLLFGILAKRKIKKKSKKPENND